MCYNIDMETKRCVLRHWKIEDAPRLYDLAKDPDIGPRAGWLPHKNVEESKEIIINVFNSPETYAAVLKETEEIIGCISLMFEGQANVQLHDKEAELGYWLGKAYWGQGIIPEAAAALLAYGFQQLGLTRIFCGYYKGNEQSRRVQEKLGFQYQYTRKDKVVLGAKRDEIVSVLERSQG